MDVNKEGTHNVGNDCSKDFFHLVVDVETTDSHKF